MWIVANLSLDPSFPSRPRLRTILSSFVDKSFQIEFVTIGWRGNADLTRVTPLFTATQVFVRNVCDAWAKLQITGAATREDSSGCSASQFQLTTFYRNEEKCRQIKMKLFICVADKTSCISP